MAGNGLLQGGGQQQQNNIDPYGLYDGLKKPYENQARLMDMQQGQQSIPYGRPQMTYAQQPMRNDQMFQEEGPIFQEQQSPAIGASVGMGYQELPQDFGGVDNMASIRASLRNPVPRENTLPNFRDMSGMGLGKTAPKSYNMSEQQTFRKSLINDLLNMMGT